MAFNLFNFQPTPDLSPADKLSIFGAMLHDIGSDVSGDGAKPTLPTLQAGLQNRALMAKIQGLMAGDSDLPAKVSDHLEAAPADPLTPAPTAASFGDVTQIGSPSYSVVKDAPPPPKSTYEKLRPALAIWALKNGKPAEANTILAPDIEVANGVTYDKHGTPTGQKIGVNLQNNNGFITDMQDAKNVGKYLPKLMDNATPLYDDRGRVVAQRLLNGTIQGIEQSAAAQSRGTAEGGADYAFIDTPTPNGAPQVRAKSTAAGQVFTGQSPSDASVAAASTKAQIDLPATTAATTQAIETIEKLKNHPALGMRTGAYSVLPSIPGTSGKDFDTLSDSLKGKLFMQAYNGLRGGGQITEVEGQKATDAFGNLNRAQTPEAYKASLDDLENVLKAGLARAQTQASAAPTTANQGQAAAGQYSLAELQAEARRRAAARQGGR